MGSYYSVMSVDKMNFLQMMLLLKLKGNLKASSLYNMPAEPFAFHQTRKFNVKVEMKCLMSLPVQKISS